MSAVISQQDLDVSPAELEELGFTHDDSLLDPGSLLQEHGQMDELELEDDETATAPRADGRRRDDDEEEETSEESEFEEFDDGDDDAADDDDADDDLDEDEEDDDVDDVDDEGFDDE